MLRCLERRASVAGLLCGLGVLVAAAGGCGGQTDSAGSHDSGSKESQSQADSGSTGSQSQPDSGGTESRSQADSGGTATQSQADSGGAEADQCAIVLAENYDQSCSEGTDCVVAFEEFSCGSCAVGAINSSAQPQYEADSKRLPDDCYNAIYPPPFVCCVAGVCQAGSVCFPDGSVTGAACAAAGGKCQAGRPQCSAAPASAQDCFPGYGPSAVCCFPPAGDGGSAAIVRFGSCDNPVGYAVANAGYCPGLACDTYYVICDGTAWSACDCDIPSGYVLLSGPNLDFGSGPPGCPPSQCDLGNGGDAGVRSEGSVEAGVSESGNDASDGG